MGYLMSTQPSQPTQPGQSSGDGAAAAGAPATRDVPPAIIRGVMLTKVGAALALVNALIVAIAPLPADVTGVEGAASTYRVVAIVSGLIGAAVWWWMATMNAQGRNWARVLVTIGWALSALGLLWAFSGVAPALSVGLQIVTVVLGGYILFGCFYRPEASEYYQRMAQVRR